jgi:hypothetical protein
MKFRSLCAGASTVMLLSVVGVGCEQNKHDYAKDTQRAEQAAARAEDAARRAESAAGRVEAAANRAEAAAEHAGGGGGRARRHRRS